MTDMRRTILWVVFTMSLVLLWDAWNKHNGHPPLFFGTGTKPVVTAPAAGSAPGLAGSTAVPAPMAGGAASTPAATAAAPVGGSLTPATSTAVTVSSDLIKATFDSTGASLVRLELLHYVDQNDKTRNVVLFDHSAERVYQAQTGLVGAPDLPSHLTPMQWVSGPTTLADGADELSVRFESPVMGGVQLAKTYTFARGSYAVKVKHEVQNHGTAPISPQLYQQLVRDGNKPPGESSFYSTFTGPAIYTDASKFKKIEFKDIEKGGVSIDKSADNGWVAMVQHYFISAWLHDDAAAREFYARKVDTNLYAIGQLFALGPIEPGQTRTIT
ncbi:MAG: hypothetical protein RLZZ598_1103, partial [Pseudomonadota bacterium]